jgi:hypothetical protein
MTERTLKEIVAYSSGSSWDGTHFRDIEVAFKDEDHVTVSNVYEHHRVEGTFTYAHIVAHWEETRDTLYFSDFCHAMGKSVPGVSAITDEQGRTMGLKLRETGRMAEAAVRQGTQRPVPLTPRLRIR